VFRQVHAAGCCWGPLLDGARCCLLFVRTPDIFLYSLLLEAATKMSSLDPGINQAIINTRTAARAASEGNVRCWGLTDYIPHAAAAAAAAAPPLLKVKVRHSLHGCLRYGVDFRGATRRPLTSQLHLFLFPSPPLSQDWCASEWVNRSVLVLARSCAVA